MSDLNQPPPNPFPYQTWVDDIGVKRIFCSADGLWYLLDEDAFLAKEVTKLQAKLALAEKQLEEQRIHLRGLLKVADEESAQVALARVKKGLQGYLELMENGWEIAPEPLPIPELRLKLALAVEALENVQCPFDGSRTCECSGDEACCRTVAQEALAKIRES